MRDELHLLEIVDRYLDGAMGVEERSAFEARLAASQELRQAVVDQRELRGGLERIPVRASVAKAYATFRFMQWLPAISLSSVAIMGAGAAWWWMSNQPLKEGSHQLDPVIEMEEPVVASVPLEIEPDSMPRHREVSHTLIVDTVVDTLYVATLNGKRVSWDDVPKNARIVEVRPSASDLIGDSTSISIASGTEEVAALRKEEIASRLDGAAAQLGVGASDVTTTEPMFKGGWDAMHSYLQQNIRPVKNSDASGVVEVDFLVDELGRISDAKVKQSLSEAHDKEALRVIKGMPKWLPCKTNGKPARCRMVVPLRFGGVVSDRRRN